MPNHLKHSLREILNELINLYHIILNRTLKENKLSPDTQKEIEDKIFNIKEKSELLSKAIDDVNWDDKTNRKFQKLNTLLLITPTVIGIIILIYGMFYTRVKIMKSQKKIQILQDSVNLYKYSSTYILYHHYWKDDTLGTTHTKDVINEEGDTIKNRKYSTIKSTREGNLSHYTVEGVSSGIHIHDTLKLNRNDAKLMEEIINRVVRSRVEK